jgi:hypothetical protein
MEARLATNKGLLPKDIVDDKREPDRPREHSLQVGESKFGKINLCDRDRPSRHKAPRKRLRS